jgi:hypothetical protein
MRKDGTKVDFNVQLNTFYRLRFLESLLIKIAHTEIFLLSEFM